MKLIYVYLITVIFLFSCGGKETISHEGYLPEQKMVEVLVDMHLLEGYYGSLNRHDDTIVVNTLAGYDSLFARHGISKEEFEKNLDHYGREPENMLRIMEKVTDSLNVLEVAR
ncbi:MAG: DUF4296 domain-containing protein [Bacteroidota bacterium]